MWHLRCHGTPWGDSEQEQEEAVLSSVSPAAPVTQLLDPAPVTQQSPSPWAGTRNPEQPIAKERKRKHPRRWERMWVGSRMRMAAC